MITSAIRKNECPRFAKNMISDLLHISTRTTRTITAMIQRVPKGGPIRDCGKGVPIPTAADPSPEAA